MESNEPNKRYELRNVCFTLNNWTQEEYDHIVGYDNYVYLIIGKEVGKEKGTPHLQGFMQLKKKKRWGAFKKEIGQRVSFQFCKGNAKENIAYCSKDGDFREWGEVRGQGKRADIKKIKELVKKDAPLEKIWRKADSYQAYRMGEIGKKLQVKKRRESGPIVEWFYGKTDKFKTRSAYERLGGIDAEYEGIIFKPCGDKNFFWEGYEAQTKVILDDFRGHTCRFNTLLKWLDRYPVRVSVKHGSRWMVAEHIIITSDRHPAKVYNKDVGDIEQLLRRIHYIHDFTQPKALPSIEYVENIKIARDLEKERAYLETKLETKLATGDEVGGNSKGPDLEPSYERLVEKVGDKVEDKEDVEEVDPFEYEEFLAWRKNQKGKEKEETK